MTTLRYTERVEKFFLIRQGGVYTF